MNTELSIDTSKTALIVIDLQKGIVGMEGAPHTASDVVIRATSLAKAFRAKSAPIFWVRVTPSADKKDALTPETDTPARSWDMPSDWADLVPELEKEESDFVITKHQWGAFYGTELELQLRRRGIDTIVLCGISTNIGVESTARFAYEYGFNQVFVEDAMTARSAEEHAMSTNVTFPRIGKVRSTEEVLAALG
jgi:nicotinamidase-related amidase